MKAIIEKINNSRLCPIKTLLLESKKKTKEQLSKKAKVQINKTLKGVLELAKSGKQKSNKKINDAINNTKTKFYKKHHFKIKEGANELDAQKQQIFDKLAEFLKTGVEKWKDNWDDAWDMESYLENEGYDLIWDHKDEFIEYLNLENYNKNDVSKWLDDNKDDIEEFFYEIESTLNSLIRELNGWEDYEGHYCADCAYFDGDGYGTCTNEDSFYDGADSDADFEEEGGYPVQSSDWACSHWEEA